MQSQKSMISSNSHITNDQKLKRLNVCRSITFYPHTQKFKSGTEEVICQLASLY